jgi:methyl-accepting chemotaxis protein
MDGNMFNRLSVKLLLPTMVVGIIAILLLVIFSEEMSKLAVISTIVIVVALQTVIGFIYSEQQLSSRIKKLEQYLSLVISTEQAPTGPLKDANSDDLAYITNQVGDFVANLADVITELRAESDVLKQGSEQLSSHMSDSVHSINDSTAQIEQMAQSIEAVASTSNVLSQNAAQVSETTNQVLDILSQGTQSSNTSQKTIETFAKDVTEMATDLALLKEESSRIGSVLDVIRGIADQTNLLALNAAIEAARAGEQGRGFAVVADEVRALAHRTQEATVEIQSMVEGLQEKSTNAVTAITRGQELSQDSLTHSAEVVDALARIGQVFTEVDTLTSQIATGTNEQQQSTASINDNMASVVSLSREINEGLCSVAQHAEQQQSTSNEVDTTLNRICV